MIIRFLLILFFFSPTVSALETVKIGVLAKRSTDITLTKWSATADYLNREIKDYQFKIVPLGFEALQKSVANNEIDFVLTNTAYYVELEYLYGISRIATLKNLSSKGKILTRFGGVIITKKNSIIKTLNDLQGKHFGAVNINSFGGWMMAQKELYDNGITLSDFSRLQFFNSHDSVVMAVKAGKIDAGTIRTDTLERMAQEGLIDLNQFDVLAAKNHQDFPFQISTELYPEWPFAKLSLTSNILTDKVLIALLQMRIYSKAAQNAHIAGWTIPLDYSKAHRLLKELKLGPYASLGKLTFSQIYQKYKVWLYGTLAAFLTTMSLLFYFTRLNVQLKQKKAQIESLNTDLEQKVQDRTLKLKTMYAYEKDFKDFLTIIADVKDLLLTSIATQSSAPVCLLRLAKHKHYCFVWVGILDEKQLEVICQSVENEQIINHKFYNLKEHKNHFIVKNIQRAIELNQSIIEQRVENHPVSSHKDNTDCVSHWMITLLLRCNKDEVPFGNLTIYSNNENGFEPEEVKILEELAIDIGLALNSIRQCTVLTALEEERIANHEEMIMAFVNIIEQRDSYTAGHSFRVAKYCRLIAKRMNIDEEQIQMLEKAAILHDIGKVATPDSILLKPGRLTTLEYQLIQYHPEAGYQMLSQLTMYQGLAEIIKFHHVRYDGKGYPETSASEPDTIPLLCYIIAVADAFDAMTTKRIYKPRKVLHEALEEIEQHSGSQFHPDVAKAAVSALVYVEIIDVHQTPDNDIERHRFAYFFMDALTNLFNENYLLTLLIRRENDQRCLTIIELKNFSDYNNEWGWNKGDQFLQQFSEQLKTEYQSAIIARYHGDDFILLFETHQDIAKEDILVFDVFEGNRVDVSLKHYDLMHEIPIL